MWPKLLLDPFRYGIILPPQGNERNFGRTVSKYSGFEPRADPKQDIYIYIYIYIYGLLYNVTFAT